MAFNTKHVWLTNNPTWWQQVPKIFSTKEADTTVVRETVPYGAGSSSWAATSSWQVAQNQCTCSTTTRLAVSVQQISVANFQVLLQEKFSFKPKKGSQFELSINFQEIPKKDLTQLKGGWEPGEYFNLFKRWRSQWHCSFVRTVLQLKKHQRLWHCQREIWKSLCLKSECDTCVWMRDLTSVER